MSDRITPDFLYSIPGRYISSTRSIAVFVISTVSAEGVQRRADAKLEYCGRSSRKRLLPAKTQTQPDAESWARSLLQQLAAKVATDAFKSYLLEIILEKLREVVIVCLFNISDVSMQGCPFNSSQV